MLLDNLLIARGLGEHISLSQWPPDQFHSSCQAPTPRMEPLRNPAVVKFGSYEIVFESGEVRRAGVRIKVQQQPLRLLEILLERPGVVVTREELRSRVWVNESFGYFDKAVNIAIAKLRSALGDSAENPRYIETIPKRGYRFIAEVSVVDAEISPTRAELESGDLPGKDSDLKAQGTKRPDAFLSPRRHLQALWIFTSVAVLVLFVFAVWRFRLVSRPPAGIRSIAVLPLANFSGDASQDYFADGMTDQLITDLAQISALRVISRTSAMAYKGTRKPLPEIAQELHVDAVVEGAVERSGDRVRITAQLIEASSDKHLWAES